MKTDQTPRPDSSFGSIQATEIATPEKPRGRNKFAFACAILASMTSILSGYHIGVMSGATIFIKDDLKISDTQIEIGAGIIKDGLGPIAWVYSSKIFPLRLRAQGESMGVALNRLMSGVISMTFIPLYKAITISGSFFLYAGIATVGWIFFYAFLPETGGRTLEDIETLFEVPRWKSAFVKKGEKTHG